MTDKGPMIRTLAPAEVETLVGWAAAEGWNPGLGDAAAFREADPQGFLGAFVGDEMVAGISAVAYGSDFGFIGLYICRQDMRGKGFGRTVWDAGMARLVGRTVGLDGVPAQQGNYRRMGFVPTYRTLRFSGLPALSGDVAAGVRTVTADIMPAITEFDRSCFPAARPRFLQRWVAPPHDALAVIKDETVLGYGVARRCRDGFKIGPLFARDPSVADRILAALAARCAGMVHIDVPERQADFIDRLTALRLSAGFETARMYRGGPPSLISDDIFAVTTLELG